MKILLVDDHPIIVDGHINALSMTPFRIDSNSFLKAHNCEEANFSLLRTPYLPSPLGNSPINDLQLFYFLWYNNDNHPESLSFLF